MSLFGKYRRDIEKFLDRKREEGRLFEFAYDGGMDWPSAKNRNMVIGKDVAVELGNPKDISTSFLLWENGSGSLGKDQILIIGPDLNGIERAHLPFGKVVIIGGEGFDESNSYERYRALDQVRYDVHLKGYMMRGVSQYQREWSRVSKEAVENGFSFRILGSELIRRFSKLEYVRTVTVIFITSSREDVLEMKCIGDGVIKLVNAMNKITEEFKHDCAACDYTDVCNDVAELRAMRKVIRQQEEADCELS